MAVPDKKTEFMKRLAKNRAQSYVPAEGIVKESIESQSPYKDELSRHRNEEVFERSPVSPNPAFIAPDGVIKEEDADYFEKREKLRDKRVSSALRFRAIAYDLSLIHI